MHRIHRLRIKVKFLVYQWVPTIIVALVAAAIYVPIHYKYLKWEVLVSVIGGLFTIAYTIQKHQLEEVRLFRELFGEFNKRFDGLNKDLNRIRQGNAEDQLKNEEIDTLYKYFNLCAEEYLYYTKGYIYPEVWSAWWNGMIVFCRNPRIRRIWSDELNTNAYYGFPLPC